MGINPISFISFQILLAISKGQFTEYAIVRASKKERRS
jgi:hypothetical protein